MKKDKITASVFFLLTLLFILAAAVNREFFDWIYTRHHSQWSWYIRPVFLIPFCFFAYRRNWSGIAITIFCLFTSMAWFNPPAVAGQNVKTFLQFEKDWLFGDWTYQKILLAATVPVSFIALGLAFWKRSLFMGLGVIILMATGKVAWSVYNAGDAGKSIMVPAATGLFLCLLLIFFGFRRLARKPPSPD